MKKTSLKYLSYAGWFTLALDQNQKKVNLRFINKKVRLKYLPETDNI